MGSARQEEESSEFSSEFAGCVSCIQGASSPHLPTGQGWAGEPSATGWTLAAKSVTHPSGFCVPELGRAGEARVPEGSGVVGVHSALHTPSRGYAPIWAGSGCRGAVASLWLGSLSTSTRPCPASWGHGDQDPTAVLPQQHRTWFPGENSSAAPFPVPIPTWEVPKLAGRGGRPSLTLPPPPAARPMTCHPDVRSRGAVQGRSRSLCWPPGLEAGPGKGSLGEQVHSTLEELGLGTTRAALTRRFSPFILGDIWSLLSAGDINV